jgi:hypothetical protein
MVKMSGSTSKIQVASYGCRVEADSIRITDVTQEDIICSR